LSLSTESVSHSAIFFFHNKLANNTFSYNFSDNQSNKAKNNGFIKFQPTPRALLYQYIMFAANLRGRILQGMVAGPGVGKQ
jgi:hypothetical protein